jgi:hypothetical protein
VLAHFWGQASCRAALSARRRSLVSVRVERCDLASSKALLHRNRHLRTYAVRKRQATCQRSAGFRTPAPFAAGVDISISTFGHCAPQSLQFTLASTGPALRRLGRGERQAVVARRHVVTGCGRWYEPAPVLVASEPRVGDDGRGRWRSTYVLAGVERWPTGHGGAAGDLLGDRKPDRDQNEHNRERERQRSEPIKRRRWSVNPP